MEYFRYIIQAKSFVIDLKKIEVAKNWPTPNVIKELKRFLRLVGYHRKLIREFGIISKPLIVMLKKDNFS